MPRATVYTATEDAADDQDIINAIRGTLPEGWEVRIRRSDRFTGWPTRLIVLDGGALRE